MNKATAKAQSQGRPHDPNQWLEDCGEATKILIMPNEKGIPVGIKLGEKAMDLENPTIAQALALVGAEAIRKAIKEMFDVEGEQISADEAARHLVKHLH
ncbi:hypothetical protein [Marinobacter sp. MCTG268]|uniref:hypothetical protein n=1 Tax=Marinobacter adhaerens TaxID=1033846 RepID=UPI000559F265